jgi:long-chain acyl-CoA synthetase
MSSDRLASDDPTPPAPPPPSPPSQRSPPECWVFDVDGCVVDSLTGSSLRPGARAILEHLAAEGRRVILWSAGGDAYARSRAEEMGVDHLVDGFFAKDGRDTDGCYRTGHLPLHQPPDRGAVFVDDHPEDLARSLDVIAVSPYLSDDPFDRGLQEVTQRAGLA